MGPSRGQYYAPLPNPAGPLADRASTKHKKQWKRAEKIALWGLVATIVGIIVTVALSLRDHPLENRTVATVQRCLTGEWRLQNMTSTGDDHGHKVSYSFQGAAYLSFNADGTGSMIVNHMHMVTSYDPDDWAPIEGTSDGAVEFHYTLNDDPTHLIRISYTDETLNGVENGITYDDGDTAADSPPTNRPDLWLTNSYVKCGNGTISLRDPGAGRQDNYVLDRY